MRSRGALAYAALDLLGCLMLVIWMLVAPPTKLSHSIETLGKYAVVATWAAKSCDDVDLYVRDPAGNIVYFYGPDAGLMHLEHDDIGCANDSANGIQLRENEERTILRGVIPGEYIANVHMYARNDPGVIVVTVKLYRLRGADRQLLESHVSLAEYGDEKTAFRFTLNGHEDFTSSNHWPKKLVGSV